MTETSTLTAQEMADKIAELEGDVLALRGALGNFASGYELNGAPLPLTRELEQSWDALSHTAQAGRDFHDQKDLFKSIHSTISQGGEDNADEINWRQGHIYTVDIFLWVMAAHGYTLQRSRSKAPTLPLEDFMQKHRENTPSLASLLSNGGSDNG